MVAFRQDIGEVVTIPAGARIKLLAVQHDEVGLWTVSWDGLIILALGSDVRENGVIRTSAE